MDGGGVSSVETNRGRVARRRFPNPFYLLLMVVSTGFVVTALAYLVVPMIAVRAMTAPGIIEENPGTPWLMLWLDEQAPRLLGAQFVAMLVLGLIAMASDGWFEAREAKRAEARRGDLKRGGA